MANPDNPKPKPKNVTKKRIVGSGKGIGKIDAKAWGPRKPKTGKSTGGRKK